MQGYVDRFSGHRLFSVAPIRRATGVFQETVEADNEILKLNNIKFKGGESAITDVYQAANAFAAG